ncbi:MAG: choice-of-anchor B family protein [Saprospiraceae bacterium]
MPSSIRPDVPHIPNLTLIKHEKTTICNPIASCNRLFCRGPKLQYGIEEPLSPSWTNAANICGYVQDGKEYALVGASQGLVIVDITDPANPNQIVQIPGPDNLWKEIKVYQHYAYITSEGGGGVQIVDMSNLPSSNLQYHNYNGDGPIANNLVTIHALHIDTNRGFLYAYGSNAGGGAIVLDLNTDPYNPTYAGQYQGLQYIHDGYADNDTLYGCHIYTGLLSIVDMNDKANPNLLGTVQTPVNSPTMPGWTDDHLSILTTDETTPSFLTSYDISDPTDIKELDRFQHQRWIWIIGTQHPHPE